GASVADNPAASPPQSVLSEIDHYVRGDFWDPKLKGGDWTAAVSRAEGELKAAKSPEERDAVYDRLLAALSDSHTFRLPAGRLPQRGWGTAGLRIGRDGDGWAGKGGLAGSSAQRAGLKLGHPGGSGARQPY